MVGVPFPWDGNGLNKHLIGLMLAQVRVPTWRATCLIKPILGRISSLYGSFTEGSQSSFDSRAHRIDGSYKDSVSTSKE